MKEQVMRLKKRKHTIKSLINRIVRVPQRISVTTLSKDITVQIEVFKNKQIISVASTTDLRYLSRI